MLRALTNDPPAYPWRDPVRRKSKRKLPAGAKTISAFVLCRRCPKKAARKEIREKVAGGRKVYTKPHKRKKSDYGLEAAPGTQHLFTGYWRVHYSGL
jgi:hypothetical protein